MLATAIGALKMLHGYREAELVAARVAASKMGFITSPDGDGYTGDDYRGQPRACDVGRAGKFRATAPGHGHQVIRSDAPDNGLLFARRQMYLTAQQQAMPSR